MLRRSIVLDGVVTSISMEEIFWEELDCAAKELGVDWYAYVRVLLNKNPHTTNRSACLRAVILGRLKTMLAMNDRTVMGRWRVREMSAKSGNEVVTHTPRLIVGRSSKAQICIDDALISRRHSLIAFDGEDWWIVDLGSTNGMSLHEESVRSAKMDIQTTVRMGRSLLTRLV